MNWKCLILLSTLLSFTTADPIFDIFALSTFDEDYDYEGYRLPETLNPSLYEVDLTVTQDVFQGTNTNFTGKVAITFEVVSGSVTEINLHSKVVIDTLALSNGNTSILVTSYDTHNTTTDILTIVTGSALAAGLDYVLEISYTGTLDTTEMQGFYRSEYENENGTTEYLVTTQFQPTHARDAFPCFDEPEYKALFVVSLTYPTGLTALTNTAQNGTTQTIDSIYEKVTFLVTPKMSTYLLAFIISKFTCTTGLPIDTNVPHRVCSRSESEEDRALAVEVGTPLMQTLENITGIKYGSYIGKVDQVAIPDFDAGAMENWGLVTYRETALLWSENDSSNAYKQRVATVVAHEFTHMWFGDLVTLKWWDYCFLNEGFARFYQYFATAMIDQCKDWELEKQFVIEQVQTSLLTDSSSSSAALTAKVSTPSQISNKFGTISYNKGASIYRMVECFIGAENFLSGIRAYLSAYSLDSVVPKNLWDALANHTSSSSLPDNTTLNEVMENWTDLPGYPVVTVTTSGQDVVLTQERFLLSGTNDTQWYVPISYTLSSDENKFTDTSAKLWLIPGTTLTIENALNNSDWIIVNNQQNAYYRVNYDTALWSSIKTVLHENHETIDVLNRAQIVDDVYNFARSGLLKYSTALEILTYLRNETEYYPWYPAITGINHLLQRVGYESTLGELIISYVLELLQNLYASVPFSNLDENNQVYTLKQVMALTRVCRFGDESCIASVKELFENFKNGSSVPKNLRAIVYCNAMRHSEDIETDFNFLWAKYVETNVASEKVTILSNLGCTTNTTYLNWYLDQSVNASSGIKIQDLTYAWSSVYGSGAIGANTAMQYLTENYDKVTAYYSGVGSLVSNIAARFTSEDQLDLLEAFLKVGTLTSSHNSTATSALTSAKSNIAWVENIREDLESFFKSGANSIAQISFLFTVVLVFLQQLL